MVSKDGTVAATGSVCGDMSNPLIILPKRAAPDEVPKVGVVRMPAEQRGRRLVATRRSRTRWRGCGDDDEQRRGPPGRVTTTTSSVAGGHDSSSGHNS
ncbi:hypothetical protein Syun_024624 [Stephania yunnanensis]|uniref:Uncharacterized protein n=1 Tax=Stephania yunnanensis TaxID=152371 RepID=A0AAP0I4R3_9MAGN